MNKPRFNIGDGVFYVSSSSHYGKKEPCRVCFGKLKVAVVLGNGEQVMTECQFCQVGVERPSGESMTWDVDARIVNGTITGIRSEGYGWRYEVSGTSVDSQDIFATSEEATPVMQAKLKEVTERKKTYDRDHFVTATKKQIWSAGYHRSRIADAQRTIDWHLARLCMIAEKSPAKTKPKNFKQGEEK